MIFGSSQVICNGQFQLTLGCPFFNMLFFLLLITIAGTKAASYRVEAGAGITAFRRVGYLTDGAGHAHLRVAFNRQRRGASGEGLARQRRVRRTEQLRVPVAALPGAAAAARRGVGSPSRRRSRRCPRSKSQSRAWGGGSAARRSSSGPWPSSPRSASARGRCMRRRPCPTG